MSRFEREIDRLTIMLSYQDMDMTEYGLMCLLLTMAKAADYPQSLPVSSKSLEAMTSCSKQVLLRARARLETRGLIEVEKGDRNTTPVYQINYLEPPNGTSGGTSNGTRNGTSGGTSDDTLQKERNAPLSSPLPPVPPNPPIIPPKREKGVTALSHDNACAEPEQVCSTQKKPVLEKGNDEAAKKRKKKPVDDSPVVLTMLLVNGDEYPVTENYIKRLRDFYPGIDIEKELRAAAGWLYGNPANRKTPRGITRYISNWLSTAQDRARATPQYGRHTPTPKPKFVDGVNLD